MPIYIPSPETGSGFDERMVAKGQIYNVTRNEKLWFQFNPETFRWTSEDVWKPTGIGVFGKDISFVAEESTRFNLSLVFVADPGAPKLRSHGLEERVSKFEEEGVQADFDEVVKTFDRWRSRNETTGRPDLLSVFFSPSLRLNSVITRIERVILDRFEDGTTREGQLDLQMLRWEPIA